MATTAKLYSYNFTSVRTYLFAIIFIAGNLLLPQLAHFVPNGGPMLLPIYFFTLIAAYKYGIRVGLLTALLSPLINNLLFVCMAEEALFRGFVQKKLMAVWSKYSWGVWLAVGTASLLFGAAHYAGGDALVLTATFAGMGYGWLYYRTDSIEASIVAHFLLNLLHFFFFTYPFALPN